MLSLRHRGIFLDVLITHNSSLSHRDQRVTVLILIRDIVSQTRRNIKASYENLSLRSQIPLMSKASNGS